MFCNHIVNFRKRLLPSLLVVFAQSIKPEVQRVKLVF